MIGNFKKSISCLYAILLLCLFGINTNAQTLNIDEKVDSLLQLMTLEEKVGQMNQYNGFYDVTGPAPESGYAKDKFDHLKAGMVGSMLNVTGVEQIRKIQEIVVNESRLGIPLIFAFDVIHGYKTTFPIPLAEAASWDLDIIEKSARVAAIEASAGGLNWTFAPMVDISRDARWGRVMEGAGEDPYYGSKVATARVKGFQGDDLTSNNTVAATAKHFAAYGFAESGRDYNAADIGSVTLHNIVLPPFKAAVDADVKTIMNSFNTLNGIPASGDSYLMRDILKGKWAFNGSIVSDWASIGEMVAHSHSENLKQAAEHAANAGTDIDMEAYAFIGYLSELVKEGKVDEALIDDSVRRILRLKYELGLFDDPYKYCNLERESNLINHADHHQVALESAKKSIVLLKNEKDLLPLSKVDGKIGVIGMLAQEKSSPLGSWRLGSDDGTAVSLIEGLAAYRNDIAYVKGPDFIIGDRAFVNELTINEDNFDGLDEAIAMAKEVDVVLMALGEVDFQTGEGRSRTNLNLPGIQQKFLESIYEVNPNIVLILSNGRPLTINWAAENVPSILETWHLGSQSGHAIAQTLFGDNNPGGKLPMTFPRSVGQIPIYYNQLSTGRPDPVEMVFWSHYSDESNKPLYPFGFGLSYTKFEYSNLKVDDSNSQAIQVQVDVKNIGAVAGEEVVQLYIRDLFASVVRPVKELKGFEKILLKPGESKTVQFSLTDQELGFYNQFGEYVVEAGEFQIMVGTNSEESLKASFELKK